MTPRGIRNNNPLNIRRSNTPWLGKCDRVIDPEFEQFRNILYGIRAAFLTIRSYEIKHHVSTVEKILLRWAPPTENNTEAYINFVSGRMNVQPSTQVDSTDKLTMCRLVSAMAFYENGVEVPFDKIEQAYNMAFLPKNT